MSVSETLIFSKVYELYKSYSQLHISFPKAKRYSLGNAIDGSIISILELVIEAEHTSKQHKAQLLQKAGIKIDLTKVLMRLACETRCIEDKKYRLASASLVEIGKMLGGWIKSLN